MSHNKLDDLIKIKIHGKGRHATVYKVMDTATQKMSALKVHPKYIACHAPLDFYMREKVALELLPAHSNIVKFNFYVENDDDAFFCMDYIDGYTLQRIIYESKSDKVEKQISKKQIKSYLLQILDAIEHCHKNNVYHGDIKPENIIIHKEKVTLVDFGSSIISEKSEVNSKDQVFLGTPGFMPPEIADHEYRGSLYLPFMDIWAFGCTMYFSYTKVVPFVEKHSAESNNNVKRYNVDLSMLPDDVRYILNHIFTKDTESRFSLDELRSHVQKLSTE